MARVVHQDELGDDASSASFRDLASVDSSDSKTPVDSIVAEDEPAAESDDDGTTNQESDDDQVEQESMPEEPRRSGRNRQQPAWMSSDTYVMATQGVPEWKHKIRLLQTLSSEGTFNNSEPEVTKAIINILTTK